MSETLSTPLPAEPIDHVLFVDDDEDVLKAGSLALGRHGFRVTVAHNPAEAWSALAVEPADVVLLDLNFSRGSTAGEEGFRCLNDLLAQDPDAVVVVVTGHSGVNIAVAAMRAGASDFVMKPWRNDRLVATITSALQVRRQRRRGAAKALSGQLRAAESRETALILGESAAIERVRDLIRRAAPTDAALLISGEPGAGKSLMAQALYQKSPRAAGPLVSADVRDLTEEDAEQTLFGGRAAAGAIHRATGGTIVLDGIDTLSPRLQSRLLTWLESGHALGAAGKPRVVTLTKQPSRALRGSGGVREDLCYALSAVEIFAPPLRECGRDALLLSEHFLRVYAHRYDRPLKPLSPQATEAVVQDAWLGNVRALRQAMERCIVVSEAPMYQSSDIFHPEAPEIASSTISGGLDLARTERAMIARALKDAGFNVSHAAKSLGLTRPALYRRMVKHGL